MRVMRRLLCIFLREMRQSKLNANNENVYISNIASMRTFKYSPFQVSKSLLPILRPFYFTRLFVDQTNAVEAQHELVRLNKSFLGILVLLEGLVNNNRVKNMKESIKLTYCYIICRAQRLQNIQRMIINDSGCLITKYYDCVSQCPKSRSDWWDKQARNILLTHYTDNSLHHDLT